MTMPYSPRKEWDRDAVAPIAEADTIGNLFVRTLAQIMEHERNAPFGGRDIDELFARDAR